MFLLWIWEEIHVRVELRADDVWESKDDKIGLLSVVVDSFESVIFEKWPISLSMVKMSTKNQKYNKLG